MEHERYIANRATLLRRVLPMPLRRCFAVEVGGPYTEVRNGYDAYVKRIDERFLAAEGKIVSSLIGDLVTTGPEGAIEVAAIVFDAMVEHAEQREKFQMTTEQLEQTERELNEHFGDR